MTDEQVILDLQAAVERLERENAELRTENMVAASDERLACEMRHGRTDPRCTCAAIQVADATRHFRECPLRAEHPKV